MRVAQSRDADDLDAADVLESARAALSARGTMARVKPSRAASRSRRSRPWTGRSSPGQADLAAQHRARHERPVAQRRGEGQGERQVDGRLLDG